MKTSIVSRKLGSRSSRVWKSDLSKASRRVGSTALTVAKRMASARTAASPKNWPSVCSTLPCANSSSTLPEATTYMQSPWSPLRTIISPASAICERITRRTSPTDAASRVENSGNLATMAHVTTNSRRRITSANDVAIMPTGSASITKPPSAVTPATSLPATVIGTASP